MTICYVVVLIWIYLNTKTIRNQLTTVFCLAEKNYYAERFSKIQGDVAKTWRMIKSVLPTSSKHESCYNVYSEAVVIILALLARIITTASL